MRKITRCGVGSCGIETNMNVVVYRSPRRPKAKMGVAVKAAVLSCAVVFVASGCAGLVAPFIHNPYAGTYNGTFTTSDGKAGPASVSLTNIGNVFGNLTDTASGQAGTLNGSV